MKSLFLVLTFVVGVGALQSSASVLDTLIVDCKVKDSETKLPLKAKVKYESLPFGSKLGLRNDSTVSFVMLSEEKFTIEVKADGYIPKTITLNYDDYIGAGKIIEEVALIPSGNGKLMRLETLTFPQGSSTITSEAHSELDQLANTLKNNPGMMIQLEGHTDFRGDPKLNLKLSKDRVEATRDYLVEKGISKNRIKTEAFGGSKPLSTDNNTEAHSLNRRVEVRILAN